MDILKNLMVNVSTPEELAKFVVEMWLGDISSDIIASGVATGFKLGGRAYEAAKIGVKIPLALGWMWLGKKIHLPSDVVAPISLGMLGGIGRDLFKLILGLAPETYGSMLGMTIATWVQTAFGGAGVEQEKAPPAQSVVKPVGYEKTQPPAPQPQPQSAENPFALFM